MDTTYSMTKKSNIVLYGAATIGVLTFRSLSALGYNIIAFIDQRADEINSLFGKPVYAPDSKYLKDELDRDSIIIITVKNVFVHESIFLFLSGMGYTKIIYKSYWNLIGIAAQKTQMISDIYDSITANKCSHSFNNIPLTDKKGNFIVKDFAFIKEENNRYLAYVPVELIFTNYSEDKKEWADIPIAALFPHIEFFSFLSGKKDSNIENYIEFCIHAANRVENVLITESWKKNVVSNRVNVFEQMRTALDIDPQFFMRNAPAAKWNERGYFNLLSGKHRAAFFISQGYHYIPLSLTKEDYSSWINKDKIKLLISFLEESQIHELDMPIPHPMLYRFPNQGGRYICQFQTTLVTSIAKYSFHKYGRVDFEKIKILDAGSGTSVFYRLFKRIGCRITRQDRNMESSDLNREIDELLYLNRCMISEADEDYDFVFYIPEKKSDFDLSAVRKELSFCNCRYLIMITDTEIAAENERECLCMTQTMDQSKYLYRVAMNHGERRIC